MSEERRKETVAPDQTPDASQKNTTLPEEAPGGVIPFAHDNDEPESDN